MHAASRGFCRALIGILLIAGILIQPLPAKDSGPTGEKISITVTEVKLDRVLRILSEKSGLKFISDPTISGRPITLDLKDVSPLEALSIMTELYNLGFQKLPGSGKYIVAPKEDIAVPTQVETYVCQFAEARELSETVSKFMTPEVGQIFADLRTNNLVLQDTPGKLSEILGILEDLDKPTKQVYIRSAIAEVSITNDHERGIQWFTEQQVGQGNAVLGTEYNLRNPSSPEPLIIPVLPNVTAGLGVGVIAMDIDMLLGLLSSHNDLHLLSTPYLMTLDNKTAEIEVGDQIPYPKLNEFGMVSYEFKNATVKLTIKAHVNNDSTITINLEPQANFQQGLTPDGIPIIATRRSNTQVIVENGKTVVLGGLMQENNVKSDQRVPILGSIPILGELFKSSQVSKKKTELIVMLTPYIIDIYNNEVTQEQLNRFPEGFRDELNKRP